MAKSVISISNVTYQDGDFFIKRNLFLIPANVSLYRLFSINVIYKIHKIYDYYSVVYPNNKRHLSSEISNEELLFDCFNVTKHIT